MIHKALLILVLPIVNTDSSLTQNYDRYVSTYTGASCHNKSVLLNCNRVYPKLCIGGLDCVLWQSGTFPSLNLNNAVIHKTPPTLRDSKLLERKCNSFGGGKFFNGIWSKKECDFPVSYCAEFRNHLSGRHVIFIGNSMVRQVFLRLVWHCREIEEIIEHFFHKDAFYVFNSTNDYLGIGSNYSASNRDIINPLFIADFQWDPLGAYLQNPIPFAVDLRIIGTTYFNFVATTVINQMKNASDNSTIFMTMPVVLWKKRRQHIVMGNLSEINTWIENNYVYHLPLSEMANTHVFGKNVLDDIHFQCAFTAQSHIQVKDNVKMPASGDCRDMMNWNIIMMLTYHLQFMPRRSSLLDFRNYTTMEFN